MSSPTYTPPPSGSGVKTALVAGALAALVISNGFMWYRLETTRSELNRLNDATQTEIAKLSESTAVTTASQRRTVESLKEELEVARQQANQAAGHAKQEAQAHADQLAKQLAAAQAKQQALVQSQLTDVRQQASTANSKIGEVSGDVSNVKTELGSTKAELEKTIASLNKVTGDLGVQSGYIATNGTEIMALKRLGERNIFEFNLAKAKHPQRVGDISITLKKTDPKHNKYTIEVLADDKLTEKKDRTINEPVQFYTLKAKQPYEIVVNTVQKDKIVGYLSTPKDQVARN